ncbi:MAG: hypothetical protein SF029_04760 [bacterium]|nr:hypothetical protein [bacterium]
MFVALVLTLTLFHPVRIIADWSLNLPVYILLTASCALQIIRLLWFKRWQNNFFALLVICALLTGSEVLSSASEREACYIDDQRCGHTYHCPPTNRTYQQIEGLPIAMSGWCYYCLWR